MFNIKYRIVEKKNKIIPIIIAVLGVLYGVSPVDVVPDVFPVVGWIDDLVITGGSLLNLVQAYVRDTSASLAKLLGLVKWLLWILGGLVVMVIALLGVTVYSLFT